jgi:hypothetical protein
MPFTVPQNPAPYPSTIGPPQQQYYGTDWGRLGGAGGQGPYGPPMTLTDPATGQTQTGQNYEWQPWVAQAPGYTQTPGRSQYAPWWRGAAFGPQGRTPWQMPGAGAQPPPPGGGITPGGTSGTFEPITTYLPPPTRATQPMPMPGGGGTSGAFPPITTYLPPPTKAWRPMPMPTPLPDQGTQNPYMYKPPTTTRLGKLPWSV